MLQNKWGFTEVIKITNQLTYRRETISIIQETGDGDWAKGTGREKAVKDNSKVVDQSLMFLRREKNSNTTLCFPPGAWEI